MFIFQPKSYIPIFYPYFNIKSKKLLMPKINRLIHLDSGGGSDFEVIIHQYSEVFQNPQENAHQLCPDNF